MQKIAKSKPQKKENKKMDLYPIKVKIGLKSNNYADYPDWTQLPLINDDSEVRLYCPLGWLYDKTSGHQEETPDSPFGQQWGYLLGTRNFIDQALVAFPTLITELTEAEFEVVYNTKIMGHAAENDYDERILNGLQTELNLKNALEQDTTELKTKIAKALDPDDPEPGIKKNKNKYWNDYKIKKGIIVPIK